MKDFLKVVDACDDIQAVKNVVSILVDGMKIGMNDAAMFETVYHQYSVPLYLLGFCRIIF